MRILTILTSLAATLLPAAHAAGQTLTGIVTDKASGAPVAGAHAIALSLPDSTVASFAATDAEGRFEIKKTPKAPFCLRISCMGLEKKDIHIKVPPRRPVEVELKAKEFSLKEVSVSRRAPGAIVRGDTITYNIAKYTDGTEQVLGDVLSKLPGISVSENGKVTSGGKLVDKVLLNGQDFTGDRHEVLTKNLPSEMVGKVELLKNYNEFSVLEGFKSKGTAINIGVDSAYTRRPTGNVELWGGYKDKYRAKGNLFFIGQEAMWSLNAKAYNTGEDAMSDEDYLELCGGIRNFADAITGRTTVVQRPATSARAYLKTDVATRRREDQIMTANAAWNPTAGLRINAYAIFNREATGAAQDVKRTFIGKEAKPAVSTREKADDEKKITSGRLDVKYETGAGALIAYRGSASCNPDAYTENAGADGATKWDSDSRNVHTEHDISFAKRFTDNQLLTLRAYGAFDKGKADVTLLSDTADPFGYKAAAIWQKTDDETWMAGGSASYVARFRGKVKLRLSAAHDFDRCKSETLSTETGLAAPKSSSDCQSTTLSLSVSKTSGKVRADAGLHLAHVSTEASRTEWKLLPEASVTVNFSKLHSIELSYESSLSRDGRTPWTATRRMANYRTLRDYAALDEMLHTFHSAYLFYMYFNRFDDISVVVNGGAQVEKSPTANDMESLGGTLIESRGPSSRDDRYAYLQLSFDKGFAFPLRFKVDATGSKNLSPVCYGGEAYTQESSDIEAEISLKTRFKIPLNVEAGGSLGYTRTEIGIMGEPAEWRTGSLRIQPILASKRHGLKVKLPVTYIRDESGDATIEYVDLSLTASKKIGQQLSIFAEGRDMLHCGKRERVTSSVYGDTEDTVTETRMPGYVIAGLKWIF